jgi:pyruvate carboxylase subunit B
MASEFGLLMTLFGVASVFSALGIVALLCLALKRLFKDQEIFPPARVETVPSKKEAAAGLRSFKVMLKGESHDVRVEDLGSAVKGFRKVTLPCEMGEELRVTVDQEEYKVRVEEAGEGIVIPDVKGVAKTEDVISEEAKTVVTAPMRGIIIRTLVRVGDKVKRGMAVAVLETMKMENTIESTVSGTVNAVYVSDGDSVDAGDVLIVVG